MEKKKMVNNKKSIKYVVACVAVLVVIVVLGFFIYNKFIKKDEKVIVKHGTVDKLYDVVKVTKCSNIGGVGEEDFSQDTLLYVIFQQLAKDEKLSDEISLGDFKKSAKKVLGDDKVVPQDFSNYAYDGYSYTLSDNVITRTQGICSDKEYKSKLYGYTFSDDELIVNVKVGYVKDGKLYNVNDEELADYDEEKENTQMDLSTSRIYTYSKNGNNYYLKSVKAE